MHQLRLWDYGSTEKTDQSFTLFNWSELFSLCRIILSICWQTNGYFGFTMCPRYLTPSNLTEINYNSVHIVTSYVGTLKESDWMVV